MTTFEQAARIALEKMEYMVAHGEWYEPEQAISALRQALEQPAEESDELYCWKVEGLTSEFTGYYAEEEAKATAKRISGTCQAFPLYVRPQPLAVERERNFCERCGKLLGGADHIHTCTPLQPAPTVKDCLTVKQKHEPVAWMYFDAQGRTTLVKSNVASYEDTTLTKIELIS